MRSFLSKLEDNMVNTREVLLLIYSLSDLRNINSKSLCYGDSANLLDFVDKNVN
jgi:hypothetical protein